MRRKLLVHGFSSAIVEAELDALASEGLQSDRRCGETYLAQRAARGFGPERMALELRERGLAADQVAELIDACDIDWCERAAQVRAKKFGASMPRDYRKRVRQMRFLHYRGFSGDQIDAATQNGD